MSAVIIIPARLGSTRLPNKVLREISGIPMIVRVLRKCLEVGVDVVVACDSEKVADVVRLNGGLAIMTDPNLPSGTDRIFCALEEVDSDRKFDKIINVQGDVPFISPQVIRGMIEALDMISEADVVTPIVKIDDIEHAKKTQVVKPVVSFICDDLGKALYFSRSLVPFGADRYYEHVGLYAYRRRVIEKFVQLKPSRLELCEKLEQLRLLESGFSIYCKVIDAHTISVDTEDDLRYANEWAANNGL